MPVERAADHPVYTIGRNTVTSLAAPSRGATDAALFRIDLSPASGLPPHRHDHLDVFAVTAGTGTIHIGEEVAEVREGDSVVIPTGELHWLEAGPDGATIVVTMLARTTMILESDGSRTVPPWMT